MTAREHFSVDTGSAAGLLEEGSASIELTGRGQTEARQAGSTPERFDVIVIGGGQAGLAVGYHLARAGLRFIILDAAARIGDAWRHRWDSLRLFTPAKLDGLDGLRFPAAPNHFPTKDEMADYLQAYASRFRLPVRNGVCVDSLQRRGLRYVVGAGALRLEADQVVVAMANYQRPSSPDFATQLSHDIVQLHSLDYRALDQLRSGPVLVAGAGNSGAEIAMEAVRGGHLTWVAGSDTGEVPFRPESFLGRHVFAPLILRIVFHRLLTVETPLGRKARPKFLGRGTPLIRIKMRDMAAAGIRRVPRVVGVREGWPMLEDGRVLDVANVIWCSGFRPGFEWIRLPVLGGDGEPLHKAGIVQGEPGLYFVGLGFLYAMSSSMIHGVSRDAQRIVASITRRLGVLRA
jgi:putative flavoprotein involved in K+ transport